MAERQSNKAVFDYIFRHAKKQTYSKHEVILRANEQPEGVYLLESGYIKAYSISKTGVENLHIVYKPGEFFPTLWAFRAATQHVFYETLDDVAIKVLAREQFLERMYSDPLLVKAVLDEMVERVWIYVDRLENLEYRYAYDRLAYRLLALLHRFGQKTPEGWRIMAPLRHQHIADSINVTRETATRLVAQMQRKGIVKYDDANQLIICDLKGLARVIGTDEVITTWPELEAELTDRS